MTCRSRAATSRWTVMRATYRSFAKVNLHLEVLGQRPDGFHELRTVFQSIDLHDLVSLEIGGRGVRLEVTGARVPSNRSNLAHRAAAAFLSTWARPEGVSIELRKRIPVGGGLGGGSSNAATVMLALRDLLGEKRASDSRLKEIGCSLGADVPFFLTGGTALGTGRGDEILPLVDLPERELWLVTPAFESSTAAVFRELADLTPDRQISSMGPLAWEDGVGWAMVERGRNDLQPLVARRFPDVGRVYNALIEGGARLVRLSGSGATLFACFDVAVKRSELESRLPPGCRVSKTRTLTRNSLQRLRVVQ
jgi:4-diphosphocytidyl-2-C-methyl-D-erythritol kinase